MSGIGATLSIAKTAIAAQQYGLTVTGHNIANVNNPDYSLQNADQFNRNPALYGGYLFGTGVDSSQIEQSVDALLENRLTNEKSFQAAFEEAEGYMEILEGYFDENSEASITSIMVDFWNSWHDLSDNPLGSSERVAVFEKGNILATRLNKADTDLSNMVLDINREISATLVQINTITGQIADLNVEIFGLEANRSANDLRDKRNALLDELGMLVDIDIFEQGNGSVIVNAAGGSTIVNGVDSYDLLNTSNQVMWQGSYGANLDITDNIAGGKLAGWLEMRDEVIPKVLGELDVLANEIIWALNYQHSQGAGLEYYSGSMTGDYQTDSTGLFSGYDFGNKIDYSQDFTMWMQDNSTADTRYAKTQMDMGVSEATISNWQGITAGARQNRYRLTVMDSAILGAKEVIETDGVNLSQVWSSAVNVTDALDTAIVEQTIIVNNGPSGTQVIEIKDVGGGAQRSASSIAQALSDVEGVEAYASELAVTFDVAGIGDAEDGDIVTFSLYIEGLVYEQRFTVDSDQGTLDEQFENALRDASNAINDIHEDLDLFASGLTLTSASGRTLGIQDFEVLDNASIQIDNFINFDAGDTITLSIDSSGFGASGATSTSVSIDLPDYLDTTDQAEMASHFYNELTTALVGTPFSVRHDPSTNSIRLSTTDGSDLTLRDGDNDTGLDASFDVTAMAGTTQSVGNGVFVFDGSGDTETFDADTLNTDTIGFSSNGTAATIEESSSGGVVAGVIVGTVTVIVEEGITLFSNVDTAGGLFDGNWATVGSSIVTLGGDNGFSNFTAGETVSFDLDGTTISLVVGGVTDIAIATDLEAQIIADLTAAGVDADYQVIRSGTSVSVLKDKALDDPIEITNFAETGANDAAMAVKTGTGNGTSDPENDYLEASNPDRNFATASHYTDDGIIKWEKMDADGVLTGEDGLIRVEEEGTITIVESGAPTLSFDISKGSLVAGNTLTVNMDTAGTPDPLNMTVFGSANDKNEIYKFKVLQGGKIGELVPDDETITIEWRTTTASGIIKLEGDDPPITPDAPLEVLVDGMKLRFFDGTLFENDAFTITTNESGVPVSSNEDGKPTAELLSDWHWTLDSFAGEFNRQSEGMKAYATKDYKLKFEASDEYYAVTNTKYSGGNGFNENNLTMTVTDWSAMDFTADDLQIARSSAGRWGIVNDPTGGVASFIPSGGDDDGFGIDFSGDGLADIEIRFAKKASGAGYVQFDLEKRNPNDISFAFSDDSVSASSGLLAAAGIHTFFEGTDATSMTVNDRLADTRFVAAARIDSVTGEIHEGDNANALALADVQYKDITMKQWHYNRGVETMSSLTNVTLDGYYSTLTGSMGIIARSIKNSREFADIMVNNLTEQRDAVSAVSLDEEMIRLMQYQHAFSAASKLLTVSDEMLNTLINTR